MEIKEVMEKLYGVYDKSESPREGCANRAIILYLFLKDKGLKPVMMSFPVQFGNLGIGSHWIVMVEGRVYDANSPESMNPFEWKEYEKKKKEKKEKLILKKRELPGENCEMNSDCISGITCNGKVCRNLSHVVLKEQELTKDIMPIGLDILGQVF